MQIHVIIHLIKHPRRGNEAQMEDEVLGARRWALAQDPGTNRPKAPCTPDRLTRDGPLALGLHLALSLSAGKRGILHFGAPLHTSGQSAKPPTPRAMLGAAPPRATAAMPPGAARPLCPPLPQPLPDHRRGCAGPSAGRHPAARHGTAPPRPQHGEARPAAPRVLRCCRSHGRMAANPNSFASQQHALLCLCWLLLFLVYSLETLIFQLFPYNIPLFSILLTHGL